MLSYEEIEAARLNREDPTPNPRGSIVNVTSDYRYNGESLVDLIRRGVPKTSMKQSVEMNHIAILEDFASKGYTHICDQENDVDIPIGEEIERLQRDAGIVDQAQVNEVFYEVLRRIKNRNV